MANVHQMRTSTPVPDGTPGIADSRWLPDATFDDGWAAIVMPDGVKGRLARQGVATMMLRGTVSAAKLPLHGVMLLTGPPGTGKTTLARGLASRIAASLQGPNGVAYLEIDPHELTSASLGRSQRAVDDLFTNTLASVAASNPMIVLFDEVETLVTDRAGLSREANPIDVHRACDAALTNLDRLASKHTDTLILATTNFSASVDDAFVSRADVVHRFTLPDSAARSTILAETIQALDDAYPGAAGVLEHPRLAEVIASSDGLDGRALRKTVAAAAARDSELNFANLTVENLLASVTEALDADQ